MDRSLRKRLEARFGERLTGPIRQRHDQTEIRVAPGDVVEVLRALHDEPDLDFQVLADLAGVDTGTHMQVVYHLWSATTPDWLRVVADGMPRDQAQYLGIYVRNHNPRLRTLPLASDVRLDLRGGDCEAPTNHQLAKLMADARAMSGSVHTYYFTLTVAGGAVDRVQEFLAINAC